MDWNDVKLALGAAQFGLDYGITNNTGTVSNEQIKLVLNLAKKKNVQTIDTAASYGVSETRLGNFDLSAFEIVTKISDIGNDSSRVENRVDTAIIGSMERLKVNQLDAVLIHNVDLLFGPTSDKIVRGLLKAKDKGLCKKIGVSIYNPDHIKPLSEKFPIDLIQAPLSIFDQRMIHSGGLKYCKDNNISVHVRSIFLQGLLICSPKERPRYFDKWAKIWTLWDIWLEKNNFSQVQGAISFINTHLPLGIERVVVGFQNIKQFKEVLRYKNTLANDFPDELMDIDESLRDPTKWKVN